MPGSYTIRPLEAKLNKDANWNTDMDAFCSFTFGSKQFQSDTAKFNGKIPTWSSAVTILSDTDTTSDLRLDLVDKKHPDTKDFLGNTQINLKEIEHKGQFKNWYPLRHNNEDIGEILLESTFEEDKSTQNQSASGTTSTRNANKHSTSQADVSEKSRVNEAKDRNQIAEGNFVTEGIMTEKPGQPFAMSDKQREQYNNNVPQGMNENMEQPQWTRTSDVDDKVGNVASFNTNQTGGSVGGFGDNIGTNPNPINNNNTSANRQDDLEGKKPAQQTSTKNVVNNQGEGGPSSKGGLTKTDVYSETQSHIGTKMNLGLIEKQNQPQKTGSGQNASVDLNRNASPSKEHKATKGNLSNNASQQPEEKVSGTSQPTSNKSGKDVEFWDSKITGLSSAEDKTRASESGKQGFFADDQQINPQGKDQRAEVSTGMQSNPSGGDKNQKLTGQNPTHKVDAEKFDV